MTEHPLIVLVTGANGQLGSALQQQAATSTHQFVFATRAMLPIENEAAVQAFFNQHHFDICINCAAYTAVDKAEAESETAMLINSHGVANIAKACQLHHTALIHISTDYVFDGKGIAPYTEDQPTAPVNAYGISKHEGEQMALQFCKRTIIIRTAWVYAAHGHNFLLTMLRLMKEKVQLNVVNDQLGCPTYANDLADALLHIISTPLENQWGIYHYCNSGVTTWYDFAAAISRMTGSSCQINPIPASAYPTPAQRPAYSVLNTSKIQNRFALTIPAWEDGLERCLRAIGNL